MSSKGSSTPALHALLSGLSVGESPRWHDGRLWFAHWGASEVIAVDDQGSSELVVRPPSPFFSIDWCPTAAFSSFRDDAYCAGNSTDR